MRIGIARFFLISVAVLAAGCATTGGPPEITLRDVGAPVWSVQHMNEKFQVALSPAGRTLRLAGSAGLVLGTGVDVVVNATYRDNIREMLGEDDTAGMLAEALGERLDQAVAENLAQAAPLNTTVGYANRREALAAWYEGLTRQGYDMLLELRTRHGVYGHDGILAVRIDARQVALPSGRTLWKDDIVVSLEPALAYARLGDPTARMSPRIRGARLTVERDVLEKWREGKGSLREDFVQTAEAAAAALVVSLGMAEDAVGEYYLGKCALNEKDFENSLFHFNEAIALDPEYADVHNAISVAYAHQGNLDEAIEKAKTITEKWPEYGPAFMNLAWWYAMKKDDIPTARPFYQRARELGMDPVKKLDERLSK
ncbi:MAG: tetratricopeptide repeat protein [Candidatus Hydrogenedentota bacterium]